MQGEPRFDRLKRDLEDVKNQPRGLEGTFRTAAEMERHRAQLADAAIEEQLEVQTAFREHGAHLQVGAQGRGCFFCAVERSCRPYGMLEGPAATERLDSHWVAGGACAGSLQSCW